MIITSLALPDPDDRRVLVTALQSQADVIVTTNLRNFFGPYLRTFDVKVQHLDEFMGNLIDLIPNKAVKAFCQLVVRLKTPPIVAALGARQSAQIQLACNGSAAGHTKY